jgi:hypothetical protein
VKRTRRGQILTPRGRGQEKEREEEGGFQAHFIVRSDISA